MQKDENVTHPCRTKEVEGRLRKRLTSLYFLINVDVIINDRLRSGSRQCSLTWANPRIKLHLPTIYGKAMHFNYNDLPSVELRVDLNPFHPVDGIPRGFRTSPGTTSPAFWLSNSRHHPGIVNRSVTPSRRNRGTV